MFSSILKVKIFWLLTVWDSPSLKVPYRLVPHTVLCLNEVSNVRRAGPSDRAVWGVGLRPLACWDCGFESRQGLGCLSLEGFVCYQVEVSQTDWSVVQRSPTKWCVCFWMWPWSLDNGESWPQGVGVPRKKSAIAGIIWSTVHIFTRSL